MLSGEDESGMLCMWSATVFGMCRLGAQTETPIQRSGFLLVLLLPCRLVCRRVRGDAIYSKSLLLKCGSIISEATSLESAAACVCLGVYRKKEQKEHKQCMYEFSPYELPP